MPRPPVLPSHAAKVTGERVWTGAAVGSGSGNPRGRLLEGLRVAGRPALANRPSEESLRTLAKQILAERERRLNFFPNWLFGETAWEILLLLYADRKRSAPLVWLQESAAVPASVVERWVCCLERDGFVTVAGRRAANDCEVMVRLTGNAVRTLKRCLSDSLRPTHISDPDRQPYNRVRDWLFLSVAIIAAAALAGALASILVH